MLDLADAALLRAGEGALLVAEELAVEQAVGHAAAVQRHVGAGAAAGEVVQRARHHLLAGAGLAVDQDVDRRAGDLRDQPAHPLDLRRTPDQLALQPVAAGQRRAQRGHLQRQAALLDGAAHHLDQQLRREGLGDEVVGAAAHRLDRQRHVAVAGDHDDRQVRVQPVAVAHQRQAVGAGQAHVGDDHAGKARRDQAHRLLGRIDRLDRQAGELQRLDAAELHVEVVLDDKNGEFAGHGVRKWKARPCRDRTPPRPGAAAAAA